VNLVPYSSLACLCQNFVLKNAERRVVALGAKACLWTDYLWYATVPHRHVLSIETYRGSIYRGSNVLTITCCKTLILSELLQEPYLCMSTSLPSPVMWTSHEMDADLRCGEVEGSDPSCPLPFQAGLSQLARCYGTAAILERV